MPETIKKEGKKFSAGASSGAPASTAWSSRHLATPGLVAGTMSQARPPNRRPTPQTWLTKSSPLYQGLLRFGYAAVPVVGCAGLPSWPWLPPAFV
jgi:hypothetical protein